MNAQAQASLTLVPCTPALLQAPGSPGFYKACGTHVARARDSSGESPVMSRPGLPKGGRLERVAECPVTNGYVCGSEQHCVEVG